jgi:Domain of unknown function (DUF4232)
VRRAVTVFALSAVAAALLASASAGRTSAAACRAAHLGGHLGGSSGAAGTIVLSIQLTNKGPACTMKGYARLQLMASARRPLRTHVAPGGLAILNLKSKLVRLERGGAATFFVAYSDVPTGYQTRCPRGTEILVRAPGDQTWIPVLAKTNACGNGSLRESPFVSGARKVF